jgi:hypothetical protein
MAWRSAWLRGRTDPLGRSSSSKGHGGELAIGELLPVVLAGGPLQAESATLLSRSRLGGALAGRLDVAGAVGGTLLGLEVGDGRADPLVVGPLDRVVRLGADGPVGVGDLVGVPVVLDLGGGVAPGPPTSGRLRHGPQRLQDIARAVGFDRQSGGPPLPGQGPHHLPILRTKWALASNQPSRRCWCWRSSAPGHEPG